MIKKSPFATGLAVFLDSVGVRKRIAAVAEERYRQTQRQRHFD